MKTHTIKKRYHAALTCVIRVVLKLTTFHLRVHRPEEASVKAPPTFIVLPNQRLGKEPIWSSDKYRRAFPREQFGEILEELTKSYCQVFSEAPWYEKHSPQKILKKLSRELSTPLSRLVVMIGNKTFPVGGFCWGEIIPPSEIPKRVAFSRFPDNIQEGMEKSKTLLQYLGDKPILYFDELAVLKPFRKGLTPIQFLIRPLLELGWNVGVKQALFWTSDESKIKPLATYMGFQALCTIDQIIFMFNSDFVPLLKITQNLDARTAGRIMAFTSRINRKRI